MIAPQKIACYKLTAPGVSGGEENEGEEDQAQSESMRAGVFNTTVAKRAYLFQACAKGYVDLGRVIRPKCLRVAAKRALQALDR